jgi:flagellar biosynthesis protein FliP
MFKDLVKSYSVKIFLILLFFLMIPITCQSQGQNIPFPSVNINLSPASPNSPEKVSTVLQIVLLLTILTLAPSILIMVTSFTRIIIIFHFLRQAIGTQNIPPNMIVTGLSLFLTFFIMFPVFSDINENAYKPYMANKISQIDAFKTAENSIRQFMFKFTREKDLALFVKISKMTRPKNQQEVPTFVLIPAFIISELKTAFQIGFVLFLPFLIIDMVTASILLSMGMMMLPPVMVSMPFKLLLFVLVDGWYLIVESMVKSFE